jgi:predicted dehydrogenase
MTKPLRFVQIGTGGFGAHWCNGVWPRLIQSGAAQAAAAVDISPDALAKGGAALGLPADRLYSDAAKAVAETKPDIVAIVVPPAFHERMVDIALAHGCDILCEKPLADSMPACARVFHKVKKAGVKFGVTMSHRFDQDKQSLEAEVKSGKYGRLHYIVHRFIHNFRSYGIFGKFRHDMADPLLIECAVHHFDIHRALSGADAATVFAKTWNPAWGEYAGDTTGLVTMTMTNGVPVMYEGALANSTQMNGWGNDYIRVEFDEAVLELDRRWLRVLRGGGWERWEKPFAEDLPLLQQPVWLNSWIVEMFCDWVAGRRESFPTNIDDNIQCAALLFAAVESAHTGKEVDVREFLKTHLEAQA